jgi:hypothetical protein
MHYLRREARVRAALRAARRIPALPLVRTAFWAARWRLAAPRLRALERACRDKDECDAALRPSRFKARLVARDLVAEVLCPCELRPFAESRCACRRVLSEALPFFGGASFTPARRALDKPIAMACFEDRAPCFPYRTWCISSRTYSPACVLGDLPSLLSFAARSRVCFSGMRSPFEIPLLQFWFRR